MNTAKLTAAKRTARDAAEAYKRERRDFCERYCPVKVGDVIATNGFSHRGKK